MVIAYPVIGKAKSYDVCKAFIDGCGGKIAADSNKLEEGDSFFYGFDESNINVWRLTRLDLRRDFYYADNSYFDSTREKYFRVVKNSIQHTGMGKSDGKRFEELNISIQPWRAKGEHIVMCPQSDFFMRIVCNVFWNWTEATKAELSQWTARKIVVREWARNKTKLSCTIQNDLNGAYALVTWSSAAAITALLSGIPAISTGISAARVMGGRLDQIEDLPYPKREEWAGVLADNQWTLDEMRSGMAWRKLNG